QEPEGEPVGPLIPLVGRRDVYLRLREIWEQVLAGQTRLTLVGGEAGVGKTRVIKSFLDATTSRHRSVVLKGRGYELAPEIPYLTLLEVLRNALAEEEDRARAVVTGLSGEDVRALSRLLPELADLRPEVTGSILLATPAARLAVFGAVGRFLAGLRRGRDGGPGEPLVLFFDDLHFADPASFDLLEHLLQELGGFPFWIIASVRPEDVQAEHRLPVIARREAAAGRLDELPVGRLDRAAIAEVAVSLVGEDQAPELARFLAEHGAGLPLALAELINYLWDEGALTAQSASRWSLAHPLDSDPPVLPPGGLDALILRRIRRLPNSTRRLATLAAVIGQSFDPDLLQDAAEEHPAVVEIGLEVMLRRWLVRQLAPYWTSNRRQPDIVLWAKGGRRGSFEFAHKMIRKALYRDIDPARRRVVHLQMAEGLEKLWGDASAQVCEALAYHFLAAGQDERALPYLEKSAERARFLMAGETARRYAEQALAAVERLATAEGRAGRERWHGRRGELEELRDRQRV
ncbi:MAG TPA: AAA family ATPase, partial [Thermoanaerobaculia bacterium]|nr:AAA family ATPase [Thermoanaerobaculia bacterium]